jgi:hypothetical protein
MEDDADRADRDRVLAGRKNDRTNYGLRGEGSGDEREKDEDNLQGLNFPKS